MSDLRIAEIDAVRRKSARTDIDTRAAESKIVASSIGVAVGRKSGNNVASGGFFHNYLLDDGNSIWHKSPRLSAGGRTLLLASLTTLLTHVGVSRPCWNQGAPSDVQSSEVI